MQILVTFPDETSELCKDIEQLYIVLKSTAHPHANLRFGYQNNHIWQTIAITNIVINEGMYESYFPSEGNN